VALALQCVWYGVIGELRNYISIKGGADAVFSSRGYEEKRRVKLSLLTILSKSSDATNGEIIIDSEAFQ
jgi:hypothetical protein